MIIANVIGGLGNQMFQVAAAVCCAKVSGQELRLDRSLFSHPKYFNPEGFLLEKVFGIKLAEASKTDLFNVLGPVAWVRRFQHRLPMTKLTSAYVREVREFCYDSRLLSGTMPKAYLVGWWQVAEYFSRFRADILRLYTFLPAMIDDQYHLWAADFRSLNTVSIHVRRGDYVSNPKYNAIFGTCPPTYYKAAIDHIRQRVADPQWIVFSDDPEWVHSQSIFKDMTVISGNEKVGSWNDMYLMSRCRYNIIANSSFSWWGAWLNDYTDKVVVAPKHWCANGNPTPGLLPPEWIIV